MRARWRIAVLEVENAALRAQVRRQADSVDRAWAWVIALGYLLVIVAPLVVRDLLL